jgi:Uma2 family endonuclease
VDHASAVGLVYVLLDTYATNDESVRASLGATLLLDDRNEPLPDALLVRPETGWLSADGFVAKVPELVVEVASPLTVSLDLNQKKRAYERNGVKEYIVWRTLDDAIDWFELVDGTFVAKVADSDGRVESTEFPGLVLDVAAALGGDEARVLAALGA